MASISIRMKKTSNVAGRVNHDFRRRTPSYADPEKEKLNATLFGQPIEQDSLSQELDKSHREKTGRNRRKDSQLIYEGIITFSTDADLTDRQAFDQSALDLLNQIAKRHGFNEPLWLVRHEDESRPHYHFAFANAHSETAKPVRLSPNDLRQLQDLAGQCFEHLGLSRGKPKEQRIEDGEPVHKWINRSVQQLHNDLPAEIDALRSQIEQLNQELATTTERAEKAARNIERTEKKLQEAGEENERLQNRLKTYQKRLENAENELKKMEDTKTTLEAEIERLKRLIEPQKPKIHQIEFVTGWEETGWWLFKRQEPVLKPAKVIDPKDAENALISTRKAAEEAAKKKVEKDLNIAKALIEAIENASQEENAPSAAPLYNYGEIKKAPKIKKYNATILDYETKLIAVGDGSKIQQAAAIYTLGKEKGWDGIFFWGMNETQIEWLVNAAIKDNFEIDFEEDWAKAYAEEVRKEIQKQTEPTRHQSYELEF